MATKNDITGDALISRVSNDKYAEGYDRVFGKKKNVPQQETTGDSEEVAVSELRESKRNSCSGS